MTKYFRVSEKNEWEGETWNFYIPLQYREQIEKLIELYRENDYEQYTIYEAEFTKTEINKFIKIDKDSTGYMDAHNIVKGKLSEEKLNDYIDNMNNDCNTDNLYKGGIRDLFVDKSK